MNRALLLQMKGISKSFPGVLALQQVDLSLHRGEVLALLGENGAGKSTLIKILAGAYRPDAGAIFMESGNVQRSDAPRSHEPSPFPLARLRGRSRSVAAKAQPLDTLPNGGEGRGEGASREVQFRNPIDAQRQGIAVIYQEFNLVPSLTARENIFLGREQTRAGFVRRRSEHQLTLDLFGRIGVKIDPQARCRDLSVAQQQIVEIAKALSQQSRIIVMDEPSATLTLQEVDRLFAVIRDLKAQGLGVIYISHRLDEIFQIADRVMVLRDGRHVATRAVADVNRESLIEMMVGRTLDNEFPKRPAQLGETRLAVEGLCRGSKVRNVSFTLRRGEVLGLTGLVGAGRTETARLIFGADRPDSGTIRLDGRVLRLRNPRDAIRQGIGLLTEDRKAQGLVLCRPARENFGLPNLPLLARGGFLQAARERQRFSEYVSGLRIRLPHLDAGSRNLSGGNQQKVVLAKWLERQCQVLIFDEPTRGIDVGAKYEVYQLMNELAAQGKAILMISSELPEVLGMSDRILVMHDGRITGEIQDVRRATQEQIMALAVG